MDRRHLNQGNPNIANTPNTGPKTPIGKLVNSMHSVNVNNNFAEINPDGAAAKIVKFDESKINESLKNYHSFVAWALNRPSPTKELSEIAKLEGMLYILEVQVSKALEREKDGNELTDKDRKDLFLMKDTLKDIHEMKYGKKQLNINGDLKDIMDTMFEK